MWAEHDEDEIETLLAYLEVEREVGPHGQLMSEATSEAANPNNPERSNPIWYVAAHHVDYAEAAIETYRKNNDLPPGAVVYVEKKTG